MLSLTGTYYLVAVNMSVAISNKNMVLVSLLFGSFTLIAELCSSMLLILHVAIRMAPERHRSSR